MPARPLPGEWPQYCTPQPTTGSGPSYGLAEPQGEAIPRQKSAEGIVVGGNEPGLPMREKYTRRPHPDEGLNDAQTNGLGKWSWEVAGMPYGD